MLLYYLTIFATLIGIVATNTTQSTGCNDDQGDILRNRGHIVVMPASLAAAQSGFSSGLAIAPLELIFAYAVVAIFAVVLDNLSEFAETSFKGSHRIIIQRIYRTIMVLGCSTVFMKIFIASGVHLSREWSLAYEFADMTSFMTALFFACQGFIIMIISIADANAWYRAASIRVEELLIDVEAVQLKQPRLWKWVWLPLCRTRDEVEFRIFRLIFSSSYHITGNPQVFNYAEVLKRTHECSLLELIDFDYWKWAIIVFIIGIVSLKSQYGYSRSCNSQPCVALNELLLFTAGGFLLVISAILLALAGRRSELKLLKRYGIYEPEDYEIYLRKEEDILEKMSTHVLSKKALMTLIADLKHDVAVKQFKKQHKLLAQENRSPSHDDPAAVASPSMDDMGNSNGRASTKKYGFPTSSATKSGDRVVDFDDKSEHGNSRGDSAMQQQHATPSQSRRGSFFLSSSLLNTITHLTAPSHASVLPIHSSPPPTSAIATSASPEPKAQSHKISIFEVVSAEVALRQFRGNLLRSVDYDFQTNTVTAASSSQHPSRMVREPSDLRRQYGRQSSLDVVGPMNNTAGLEEKMKNIDEEGRVIPQTADFGTQVRLSVEEERKRRQSLAREQLLMDIAKKKLQNAYLQHTTPAPPPRAGAGAGEDDADRDGGKGTSQSAAVGYGQGVLFRDIYLFGDPAYYTTFINWLMTGNALYLAWWLTTFTFVATKLNSIQDIIFWFLFPLVPAILTFPLLAMIIKSSTNLKAITEIDLEIVSEVLEKTEEISKYVSLLRKCLLHRLHLAKQQQQQQEQQQHNPHHQQQEQQAKERLERKAVNDLFEEVEDSHTGTMSLEDFRRMLVRLQMFLDKPIWLGMFAWIDLNHDGVISLEVSHPLPSSSPSSSSFLSLCLISLSSVSVCRSVCAALPVYRCCVAVCRV
jgi:hypothetical protein